MHEMSLMAGVFEAIEASLANIKFKKVTKIKLQVGKFTNAEPDALEFAFRAFAHGTYVEGAVFEIDQIPVEGHCRQCDLNFEINPLEFVCPKCLGFDIEIIRGQELLLESVEVES